MYSGIITRQGKIVSNEGDENGYKLVIESDVCSLVKEGDSVGVNGVCLTVTAFDDKTASFDVWPESLKRTTLKHFGADTSVHIDLPLKHGEYNGGHNILGHVDYVADLVESTTVEGSDQVKLWFSLPSRFRDLMPVRGSVAVDGVSLTITDRRADSFSVSLIPETLNRTHLGQLKTGEQVNIEVDFNSRHIQDSSGILSLSIPDEYRVDQVEDNFEWALETLKVGGAILILDENGDDTECAIVASTDKLSAPVLTFAIGMARSGCNLALSGDVAERLAIPAPVINHTIDEEDRRYLVPINHKENREHDFSAEALLRTITLFSDDQYSIGDWKCPGNVTSVQIYSEEVDSRRGVLEGAVKMVQKAGFGGSALCITLLAADGSRFDKDQTEAFAARFELPLISREDSIAD